MDNITYLELDAILDESAPYQCTVATIRFPGHIPDTVLESIGDRLVGKTVADVMDDQGFHWWDTPVSHDTVLVDAIIDRT